MSKLVLTSFGDPAESVHLQPTGDLTPGPGELLVEMEAATINASDFLLVQGRYPIHPRLPSPVGAEGVGRVSAVGPGADAGLVGRRVVILPTYDQGTWAERILVRTENVVPVGDDARGDADPLQLAMVGINPATAHVLLRRFATLSPGDWVGQTAANSAVGLYVIALAKHFGLKTLNVVRRDAAEEVVRTTGGDQVIVGTENLGDAITEALGGARLSLVLDATGGPVVGDLAHALKFGGKVVSYAVESGVPPVVSVFDMIFNEVGQTGFWVINWLREAPRAEVEATYGELVDLIAAGTLSVPVEATYPLEDYKSAFEHAAAGGRSGKILFTFS